MSDTKVSLVDEMKEAYGAYALAVIIGRAIPDLYDGLKPVTRRVLTAMLRLGLKPDGRYMKAARVEGETMGRYHPHGGRRANHQSCSVALFSSRQGRNDFGT